MRRRTPEKEASKKRHQRYLVAPKDIFFAVMLTRSRPSQSMEKNHFGVHKHLCEIIRCDTRGGIPLCGPLKYQRRRARMCSRIPSRASPVEQNVSGCATHRVLLGFLCGRARCATVFVAVCMCSIFWTTDVDFQSWLDEGDHLGVLFFAVPVGLGVKAVLSSRISGAPVPRCKRPWRFSASESETLHVRVGHSLSVTFITWRNPQVDLHGNALGIQIPHRCGVLDVDWSWWRWNTVTDAARSCVEAEDTRLVASALLMRHAHILAS